MSVLPLIVIGMHRSGTALVSRLLQSLGVFMGWRQEENAEAVSFLRCNNLLLQACGGRWDHPSPAGRLVEDPRLRREAGEMLRRRMEGWAALEYLGPGRFARTRSLFRLGIPWGWKDPRTTVTLPLWLDLFPGARVIHVVRHGVDVAASLARREEKLLPAAWRGYGGLTFLRPGREGRDAFGGSPRVLDLRGGFGLWEEYLAAARANTSALGEDLLEFRYEDLLADPAAHVARLAAFCGRAPPPGTLDGAARSVRGDRSCAWRGDADLVRFAGTVAESPWMKTFGYGEGA
jgi:hypothetical protein